MPLHHPLVLAKLVASLDRVSGGRFLFGVGVGYLEPEFRALGVPLAERGARTDEYLDAMRRRLGRRCSPASRVVTSLLRRAGRAPPARPLGPPLHVGGYVAARSAGP